MAKGGAPRGAMLSALGRGYVVLAAKRPAHFQVMFNAEVSGPETYPEMHEAADSCFNRLTSCVAEALGGRATEQNVRDVAVTAWSTVQPPFGLTAPCRASRTSQ